MHSPDIMRFCKTCETSKVVTAFGKAAWESDGISKTCKRCRAAAAQRYAAMHPEKIKSRNDAQYKKWREIHPKKPQFALTNADGRLCRTCGVRKDADRFGKNKLSRDGLAIRCLECARVYHRKWTDENREHVRDVARGSAREARRKNPARDLETRKKRRFRPYGLTQEDVKKMLEAQNHTCPICLSPIEDMPDRRLSIRSFHVDHCHRTGKVRGLLCMMCNTGIGKMRDDPTVLRSAAAYIEDHSI